jgi:predicted O-linked N-acetylglucosamine transferase (SPINDLY family)
MPTIREALTHAVALHQSGQLPQAEQIYRQVLQADPRNADAWHLLGVMYAQVNRHDAAVEHIRRAIEISPNQAVFHANLGAAYQKLRRTDEGIACFRRALELNPNYADAHSNLGVALLSRGEAAAAEASLRRSIALNPNYVEAHGNLGNALQALGRPAEALVSHQTAARLRPNYAEAQHGIGAALEALGRLDESAAAYHRALEINENAPQTYNNLGVVLKKQKKPDEAVACYRRALALQADYVEALTNLGNALFEQGKLDEAIACHQQALGLKPDFAEALNNLGNALKEKAQLPQAIACFQRAESLAPDRAETPHSLGAALKEQGKLDEAIACYRRALDLDPDYADAHNSLGIGMQEQGHVAEAIACYLRALQLQPDMPEAHNNLGNLLRDDGQIAAAIDCYQRALHLKPDMHEAHNNLGNAYKDQGRLDEALACYRRALEIKPDFADAHSNLVFVMQYRPGVTLAELLAAHLEFDRQQAAPVGPACRAGQLRDECHDGADSEGKVERTNPFRQKDPTGRLRLGFVSPDFCQHPVGFFLIRALENLDRETAEIYCYSDRVGKDHMTARFQAVSSQWRDVLGWNHERLAAQIEDDRLDVLFDLAGHTARNRMLTFARKPAPVQVTWIGYEGTTGLSAIDYLLADSYMVPESANRFCVEKVLRLPDCYLCFDPPEEAPPVGPPPALQNGYVTFASCNNLAKVNKDVVAAWAEILRRVAGSKLLLKYRGLEDAALRSRFIDLFTAQGVPAERLIIEGWSPLSQLMTAHNRFDIALDPFPFAGGVTTCNALWMGVPVVTWPGETFASRHSLSYLSNVGMTETIAGSREEYITIAAALAGDLPRLAVIRAGLRARMSASTLCDGKRFAGNLMVIIDEIRRK